MDFSVPPPGFNANVPPPGLPPPAMENNEFNPSDPFHEYSEDNMMGGFEPTASAQWSVPPPAGLVLHLIQFKPELQRIVDMDRIPNIFVFENLTNTKRWETHRRQSP